MAKATPSYSVTYIFVELAIALALVAMMTVLTRECVL
jgi:hypothetical protein